MLHARPLNIPVSRTLVGGELADSFFAQDRNTAPENLICHSIYRTARLLKNLV